MFVQRLSLWKTIAMEPFLIAGAVLPLAPHFSEGLVYTAFLYKMPFFVLLVSACVGLGFGAVVFLLLVWRALRRVPVLTISDTTITALLATGTRSVNKSDVLRIVPIWPGTTVNLKIRDARPLGLPVWFYEQPALAMKQLESLAPEAGDATTARVG